MMFNSTNNMRAPEKRRSVILTSLVLTREDFELVKLPLCL